MKNNDDFFNFIKENFTPTGIVFSTEKAKSIIGKNNLSPAEFLRPFGYFPKVVFNTEMSSTTITNFRLDFYDAEFYKKIPYEHYSKIINTVLNAKNIVPEIPIFDFNNNSEDKSLVDNIIEKLSGFSFPWLNTYVKTICELIRFNESELYQQPLCYIYFCAIDDNIEIVKPKLNEKDKTPSLIYERIYDPDMPVVIIIINDKMQDNQISADQKNKYIDQFKKKFNVFYLLYWELNDISSPNPNELSETEVKYYTGDLWSKYEHICEKYYYNLNKPNNNKNSDEKGKYISIASRRRFHQTINDFFVKYAMNNIEHKMRAIEKRILETKVGIKNTIFGFFKQDNMNENSSWNNFFKIYRLSMNEFQEYFFAMMCFYFNNYKQAKEVSSIFMNDIKKKSTRHYNAAYELNKLSYFLNNYKNKNKGLEYNSFYKEDDAFESFSNYIKNENYFQACRTLFSGIKIHEQNKTILKLATILSDVIPLIPGLPSKNNSVYINHFYPLINEQIATYYIILERTKKRKFLWFMTQAAIRFRKESKLDNNNYLNNYSLNDFLYLNEFLETNNKHFFSLSKNFISEQLGIIFQEMKNNEGAVIFYLKNIENYIYFLQKDKVLYEKKVKQNFENLVNLLFLIYKEKKEDKNIFMNNYYLNNFPIPQIDNSSILIIEEQDIIINNAYKSDTKPTFNWDFFKKFDYIPVTKRFLCLTPPDIRALVNLDNIIHNKQNFSNFFSKRKFHINLNKKIYVSFLITNPLPFDLNINNMKLICDFISQKDLSNDDSEKTTDTINDKPEILENDLIFEDKNIILKKETSNKIELYVQGNKEGRIIIKGVEIVLEKFIIIKHYFNKKTKTNLYNYLKKRRRRSSSISSSGLGANLSSEERNKIKSQRKESNASQNSNLSRGSRNSYNLHYKYKEEIICDIKDNSNDINIIFPCGNNIKIYKNELFLMPIKIVNNSNIVIKNFCFYFNDDSNNVEESCLLSELIFKDIEITSDKNNNNNEKTIYVPIVPKKKGKIFIKILFKFEEDKTYIDHEIQRYLITFNVQDSFSVNFKEIIQNSQPDSIIEDLDMLCIAHKSKNSPQLENITINESFYSSEIIEQIKQNNNVENNNSENIVEIKEHKVIYKKYKMKKNINKEEENNSDIYNNKQSDYAIKMRKQKLYKKINELEKKINFEFLNEYEDIKKNDTIEHKHVKTNFCKLLAKNYLIFNWTAIEKGTNKIINGLLFYKPKLNFSLIANNLLKNIIKNFISIKQSVFKMDNIFTTCILDVFIDNNFYKQLRNIRGIEIFIDNKTENDFNKCKWVGLKKYYLSNIDNNSDNIDKIQFTCLISEKGIYDLNKISLAVHSNISKMGIKIINNILSPIIVKID